MRAADRREPGCFRCGPGGSTRIEGWYKGTTMDRKTLLLLVVLP